MTKHFRRDLDLLRKTVLGLGGLIEAAIERALTALVDRRPDLARQVIEADADIDEREVDVETECLKILALHQPFAQDLRFLITVLKVNNDLERMGDLAVNISEAAEFLSGRDPLPLPAGFEDMSERVRSMVQKSLDALLDQSPDLAREVLAMDDMVDQLDRSMSAELQTNLHLDPSSIERSIALLRAIRDLERIADLATNVAEDVVFLVEAELIRHGRRTDVET
jgi:phosphate transport system protein